MIFLLSLFMLLIVPAELSLIQASVVLVVVYVSYVMFGFKTATYLSVIGGLMVDALKTGTLGLSSLEYLLIIGIVEFFMSRKDYREREFLVDTGVMVVISTIDNLIRGYGIYRILNTMVVYLLIYGIFRVMFRGTRVINVRREI